MIDLRLLVAVGAVSLATPALAETRSYELGNFHGIDISTGINAIVEVGKAFHVEARGEAGRPLDRLVVDVRNGTLRAYLDQPLIPFSLFDLLEHRNITLIITVPALDAIAASAGADILVASLSGERVVIDASSGANVTVADIAAETVKVALSSGADIELAGACRLLEVHGSSGSDLDARHLQCATAEIDLSSGTDARVFASDAIRAETSSGGDLTVFGNPARRDIARHSLGDIEFADTP